MATDQRPGATTSPTLPASGRTADVYAVGSARVLRRYRENIDAVAEAAVMEHVRAHGFPVPRVHRAGGREIEMDRVEGPTMLRSLLDDDLDVDGAARVLTRLHDDLHAVPPMDDAVPGTCIVHLDLHPDNVILTPAGAVLIDWTNATHGPADLDVAMSALILAQVAIATLAAMPTDMSGPARALLTSFLTHAGAVSQPSLDAAVAKRRADPMMSPAELDQLDDAALVVASARRAG